MITAIIVDDEPYCCESLDFIGAVLPGVKVLDICYSAADALQSLVIKHHVVFLDIEMPHMNGFEILEKIAR